MLDGLARIHVDVDTERVDREVVQRRARVFHANRRRQIGGVDRDLGRIERNVLGFELDHHSRSSAEWRPSARPPPLARCRTCACMRLQRRPDLVLDHIDIDAHDRRGNSGDESSPRGFGSTGPREISVTISIPDITCPNTGYWSGIWPVKSEAAMKNCAPF